MYDIAAVWVSIVIISKCCFPSLHEGANTFSAQELNSTSLTDRRLESNSRLHAMTSRSLSAGGDEL